MRKSYVLEHSMKVKVEMDLGEVGDLIKELSDRVGANDKEPRSLANLKKIRREAAEEAARTFKTMCEQDQIEGLRPLFYFNKVETLMTREEFFKWLNTCPTHKWDITADEHGYVVVSFPNYEEEE